MAFVGSRDESSHERTQIRASDEAQSTVEGSSDHRVGKGRNERTVHSGLG